VLLKIVEPRYPVAGRGRRPYALESMLRVHLMQNWFALSDPAMEEALYEIASLRASELERADSGRDDDPELPPPARS
jgi:IS5 family transposase